VITRIRDIAAAALDAAFRPPIDPVDRHASEVFHQLGIGADRWQRYALHNVRSDPDGALAEENRQLRAKVRHLGRDYGRASDTICSQRRELEGYRAYRALFQQQTARGQDIDTAARSTIAEALGLPTDSTTGAIVVAIRGLRETAEDPSVVEVDAEMVSFPVAAAVDMTRQLDEHEQRAEILRRDNQRLRAELDSERGARRTFRREVATVTTDCQRLSAEKRPVGGHVNPYREGEADTYEAVADRLQDLITEDTPVSSEDVSR
jgi:hypothetical protein